MGLFVTKVELKEIKSEIDTGSAVCGPLFLPTSWKLYFEGQVDALTVKGTIDLPEPVYSMSKAELIISKYFQ